MLKRSSIVRKTFLFSAMLIILVTLVSFAILYFAMGPYYLYKKEQSIKTGMIKLEMALKYSNDQNAAAILIADFAEAYNVKVASIDPQGAPIIELSSPFVTMKAKNEQHEQLIINGEPAKAGQLEEVIGKLYQTMGMIHSQEPDPLKEEAEPEAYIWYDVYEAGSVMLLETTIGTKIIDKLQIEGTLQPINEARQVILSLIPYVLAAATMIGLILAWFYARQITKPILILSAATVRMKHMEENVRSDIYTNDELGLLSENMDSLYQILIEKISNLKMEMDKVSRLERSKTDMMQSASHELKTPIAALGGMLDGMIDNIGVYKDKETYLLKCKEQVEKLAFLVKEILEASKADRRIQTDKSVELEIGDMLNQILREYELPIFEKQLKLQTIIKKVVIKTNPAVLYRAIANLISNAILYTPPEGEVHIILSDNRLIIENNCGPIMEEEMQKLFEPFYTRSSSRDKLVSGTGLGLYIVKRNLERLSIPYQAESLEEWFRITLFFI